MDYIYIVIIMLFVMFDIALIKLQLGLINFIVGIFSIGIVAVATAQSANIPFFPYPLLLLGVLGALVMFSATMNLRSGN